MMPAICMCMKNETWLSVLPSETTVRPLHLPCAVSRAARNLNGPSQMQVVTDTSWISRQGYLAPVCRSHLGLLCCIVIKMSWEADLPTVCWMLISIFVALSRHLWLILLLKYAKCLWQIAAKCPDTQASFCLSDILSYFCLSLPSFQHFFSVLHPWTLSKLSTFFFWHQDIILYSSLGFISYMLQPRFLSPAPAFQNHPGIFFFNFFWPYGLVILYLSCRRLSHLALLLSQMHQKSWQQEV